jgi:hypothetical protein
VAGGTHRQRELLRVVERYHGRNSFVFRHLAAQTAAWAASEHLPSAVRRWVQRGLGIWPRLLNRLFDGRGSPG